jgi:hypothetical protein
MVSYRHVCLIIIFNEDQDGGSPLETSNINCTFQDGLCGWIQEQLRDEVDLTRNSGPTLAQLYMGNTGPVADHFNDSGRPLTRAQTNVAHL